MKNKSKIFLVVGTPGSGKDLLIQAVNDLGSLHAVIVPKHTSRKRYPDDGNEMICIDDDGYDMKNCDITYENYGKKYGIKTANLWKSLSKETSQVIVVSNEEAINDLINVFGELIVPLFVHSEMNKDEYRKEQNRQGKDDEYINQRVEKYEKAFNTYLRNLDKFKHVLLYAGSAEDMFDQIFRLFNYYESN